MTNHVPTLKICQKMKEVGFPQETEFLWLGDSREQYAHWVSNDRVKWSSIPTTTVFCAAPILTEILEQLPKTYTKDGHTYNLLTCINDNYAFVGYEYESDEYYQDYGPIARMVGEDARLIEAAALLYLEIHA